MAPGSGSAMPIFKLMSASKINWPACAETLAQALPRERLHPAVLAWAERRTNGRKPWAVAFSGGADSLLLLLLLWAHWPGRRGRLVALHFNHALRGRFSDRDETFCRQVCRRLRVRYWSARWRAGKNGASEAEARTARFGFFERKLRVIGSRALFLGHQQDDIAETMLMRIARGSGTAGLAAPRPVHVMPAGRVHLRPLLTLKKEDVGAALRSARAVWREDSTNGSDDFFRNRIRRSVLPAWRRAADRDALAGCAVTRELLEEDAVALDAWLDELRVGERSGAIELARLAGKPRAIVRRALHRWLLARPGADGLSRQGFASLLAAVEDGQSTRRSLGHEGFAVIRRGWLRFERRRPGAASGRKRLNSKAV